MKAIGFHRHQETLTKNDSPQLRGMLYQVRHLVRVEEVTPARRPKAAAPKARPTAEPAAPETADAGRPPAKSASAEPEAKKAQPLKEKSTAEKKTDEEKAE
jgi:hypothetical protein